MQLGILPEQGGSLANLRRTGQDTRFLDQYARLYVREFDEVHYFSYADEALDRAIAPNFHLHRNPGWHRWLYTFLLPFVQRRAIRQCSVLRVMQATGAIPARLARALYGVPFVVTYGYHYSTELWASGRRLRAWLFDRRAAWALRKADGIIVTTPALAEFAKKFAPAGRIALIPNSVNTDLFAPAAGSGTGGQPASAAGSGTGWQPVPAAETDQPVPAAGSGTGWQPVPAAGSSASRKRLLAVGNLSPLKNHRLILEAAAQLGRDDLEVVILGRGPEEPALRALAAEKSVALELPGIVPNEDMPRFLQSADVYLITSTSEGHPKSLLEAMSVGLPCIGTNVRGIRDVLVDGDTGWLCPLEPEAVARRLAAVLAAPDEARQIGDRARRYVLEHYSAAVIMAREVAFLKEIASTAKR
jgi:glycosyltransferase involved in cell wall biosynthesis